MTDSQDQSIAAEIERLPEIPWCEGCWELAADGTRSERSGLPEECERCGSDEVFWI
jgi:hypothetical protein